MLRLLIIFFLFINSLNSYCQYTKQIDSLCIACNRISSDSEKVIALGKLADKYYMYSLNRQADSVLHEQLQVAELSGNNNLILAALFGNAISNISSTTTSESFDKTIEFLEKGINYAKVQSNADYIALGYSRLSNILLKRGENDRALYNANLAAQSLINVESDSVKAVVYIELGNDYAAKGESVLASTNYNAAFDIAFTIKSIPLQSSIYHCFSEMYSKLGIDDDAKSELLKSLELNKANKYYEGMVVDYYDLARLTDEKFFLDKTIKLADSIHLDKYILWAKKLMLAYIEVKENNAEKALNYLETEPDLKQTYLNTSLARYYNTKAEIYLYSNNGDSAVYYFKLVEEDYVKNFDQGTIRDMYWEIAQAYELINDLPTSISYYKKALDISKQRNDVSSIAALSTKLSELYNNQGDYKEAFALSKQAIKYGDSLRELSKEKDIVLLGVERENRKHAEELRQQAQIEKRNRDLEYMGISIAICVIFICMLIAGMFPISKLAIKMLGYFFFISLFEFIVMVIDNTLLAGATHGQPLKLWLIKIGLIASLVPLQHFLEHNLIKFLQSRKLLEVRTKFSFKKLFAKRKKTSPVKEEDIEEDTAVL